jgi:hypothetical protein
MNFMADSCPSVALVSFSDYFIPFNMNKAKEMSSYTVLNKCAGLVHVLN